VSARAFAFTLAVVVALAEIGAALALILTSDHESHKWATAALACTAGISFIAAGLIALYRRPENRTGVYLAAVGYLWFLGALSEGNNDVLYTLGVWLGNLAFIPFAALVLAYPTGRLAPRPDKLLVRLTATFVLVGPPLLLLFAEHPKGCGSECGSSAIVAVESPTTETIVDALGTAFTVGLVIAVVAVLVQRWRRATPALRRTLLAVYLAGGATLVVLLVSNLLVQFSDDAADALSPLFLVVFAAVPFAFLLGLLRSRLARGSVAALVVSIGQGVPLRDAIAEALGDPTLELAFRLDDEQRFVDRDGRAFELPGPGSRRVASIVERDGHPVGALVHDESLCDQPELIESVSAAVALALDNERLEAELRAQYGYLNTIVETARSLLVTIDTDGVIRNLNPATVEASGYGSYDEVRGKYFWDVFIDDSERRAMLARFRAAAPDFPAAEYENAFTNARGERRVIAWSSAPLVDERGKVVRLVAGGVDITLRKQQEEELRASRSRIVAAGDEARRRLERNLHDGAQQRLVALSLALRLAQARLASDPAAADELLSGASEELSQALEELRELARGIHPAVLTDRGLRAALEGLAARTPLPVELDLPAERLPEPIEAAAYYVVSEAVTNVVKHAQATAVDVRVSAVNGSVVVEVADDGVGAADPESGSGLRGLVDRLAALDGRLEIDSPESGGTRVVAEIPMTRDAVPRPPAPPKAASAPGSALRS
jgi:PAS domain S-box-containing protein